MFSSATVLRDAAVEASLHRCTHPGCKKIYLSAAALRKHNKGHLFAAAKSAALPAEAYRKPERYVPCENMRDHRRGRPKDSAVGYKRVADFGVAEAKAMSLAAKKKKTLIVQGSKVFGSLDDLLFRKKVKERLGEELPPFLRDFELDGVGAVVGEGSESYSALMEYMTGCFVAYEAEIARLNKCIAKLKIANLRLKAGEHVSAAVTEQSNGTTTSLGVWQKRTLSRHSSNFVAALLKESKQCPVKAIALAREVLRPTEIGQLGARGEKEPCQPGHRGCLAKFLCAHARPTQRTVS